MLMLVKGGGMDAADSQSALIVIQSVEKQVEAARLMVTSAPNGMSPAARAAHRLYLSNANIMLAAYLGIGPPDPHRVA